MIQAYLYWLKSNTEVFDVENVTPTLSTARMEDKQAGMVAQLAYPDIAGRASFVTHYYKLDTELALPGDQRGPLPDNEGVRGFASAEGKAEHY